MSQRLFDLVSSDGTVLLGNSPQNACQAMAANYYHNGGDQTTSLRAVGVEQVAQPAQPELPMGTQPEPTPQPQPSPPSRINNEKVLVAKAMVVHSGELVLASYPNSRIAKRAAQGQSLTTKQLVWLADRAAPLLKLEAAMA